MLSRTAESEATAWRTAHPTRSATAQYQPTHWWYVSPYALSWAYSSLFSLYFKTFDPDRPNPASSSSQAWGKWDKITGDGKPPWSSDENNLKFSCCFVVVCLALLQNCSSVAPCYQKCCSPSTLCYVVCRLPWRMSARPSSSVNTLTQNHGGNLTHSHESGKHSRNR